MATPFQRYQSGIQPVTGMLETGEAIGRMYQQGIGAIGQAIGEGIRVYGENQQKSEMADAKIAAGVARFKQIADIYGQDPEFAPVVASFAERMGQFQTAPNESLTKKLAAANEIDVMMSDLGQVLQAQQLVRSRQVERVGAEALDKFKDVKKVTDPALIKDNVLKFNTGASYDSNKGGALEGLRRFRDAAKAAGKDLQGTDAEFLDAYRRNVTDSVNKAMSAGTLAPEVGQKVIEQVEADRNIERTNAAAMEGLAEFGMTARPQSSMKDYQTVTGAAFQPPAPETKAQSEVERRVAETFAPIKAEAQKEIERLKADEKRLAAQADEEKRMEVITGGKTPAERTIQNIFNNYVTPAFRNVVEKYSEVDKDGSVSVDWGKVSRDASAVVYMAGPLGYLIQEGAFDAEKPLKERLAIAKEVESRYPKAGSQAQLEDIRTRIKSKEQTLKDAEAKVTQKPAQAPAPKAPVVGLGQQTAGMLSYEQKMTAAEKKARVADFMTKRIGFVDPATGKKTLPSGFNAWFKQAVPESEARVVYVDGIQLLWDGQKFTQVAAAKAPSIKEIRENLVGVYGNQDAEGNLVPSEFIPESGVYLSGIFRGSDSADSKFREDMGNLIDARGSVQRLQAINDKFGEALSLKDAGIAKVDLMNLKAALRRDIVGVGQVSNYEQKLLEDVIADPTAFLSFEPKDRAILLALAERIDRKIANNAAQFGLRAEIRGVEGGSRYQSLRQKYLADKGITR